MTAQHPVTTEPTKLNQVIDALSEFASTESELAAAELKPAAKHAGIGSGLFAGAATLLLHALWMLVIAAALAIGWLLASVTSLSPWASITLGFLICAVLSIIIAAVLALIGKSQIGKVRKPEATLAEAKATLQAILASLGRIKEDVPSSTVVKKDDDSWRRPQPAGTRFPATDDRYTGGSHVYTGGAHAADND